MLINDLEYFIRSANYSSKTSGMDTPDRGIRKNKDWYAYPIQDFTYQFNSWGFRGPEYVEHIGKPVNICLGDSFTVNVGGPIDHSWSSQLAEHFDIPTLNLGVDGAGNDAIRLVYDRACKLFNVQDTFVMYSFFHRRLHDNYNFIQGGAGDEENFRYFLKHRIPNVYECTLPWYCLTSVDKLKLNDLSIYYYGTGGIYMKHREQVDLNRKEFVHKEWFNALRGGSWPTYKQFISGADPHPDMLTEEFGTFLSPAFYVTTYSNRDGFHLNQKYNKIYAEYLYNQWKKNNEP